MRVPVREIALLLAALLGGLPRTGVSAPDSAFAARTAEPASKGFTATATRAAGKLRIAIEYPEPGAQLSAPDGRGFITGTALQTRGRSLGQFDVFVVIDTSQSTSRPSGADIDEDGRVGARPFLERLPGVRAFLDSGSDDPGDSVLACEVKAAKTLISQLDSESTRVGIIAFSGMPLRSRSSPPPPDARVVAPLTRDYPLLVGRLDQLLAAGPGGDTNLVAAVQLATLEFERDYLANRLRKVKRVALLISDGRGTLPAALPPRERESAAIEAAQDAAQFQARIDTYAVGKDDATALETLSQIAAATGGAFERVAKPSELVASFQALDLAQIAEISVRNVTLGQGTPDVAVDPYGTFSALVPLAEGENSLEVFARSKAGLEQRERVSVFYRKGGVPSPLPLSALARRGKLLEDRVREAYVEDMARVRALRARQRSVEVKPAPE